MELDQSHSQDHQHSTLVSEQHVITLLTSIERRTAYLITEMRKAVELILSLEPQLVSNQEDFQQRHQNALSEITISELEHYATEWKALVPNNSHVQGAFGSLLSQKYGLIDHSYLNIREALALDSEAVRVAYESQYGKSIDMLFNASEEGSKEKKLTETLTQEQQDRYDIESELEWVNLATHDFLFEEGDIGDSLYVVINGRLRVLVESNGTRDVIREAAPGEIIGEMALIAGEPRSATLEAARDTRLLRLSKSSFEQLIIKHPQIMLQIARGHSKRMRLLSQRESYSTPLATLAVIPAGPDVPLTEFCERITRALSPYGSSLHLTNKRLEEEMQIEWFLHDENDGMIMAWLSEQEMKYDFIIYQSDDHSSPWTSRCLRQADHILIVGQANGTPELSSIEQEMDHVCHIRTSLVLLHANGEHPPVGTGEWLAVREVEQHHHLRWDMDSDFERIARLLTGNGIGLVLSGGGARGLAHMGVIRALYEENIPIDIVGGTSQGAWIASVCAMGMDYEDMMSISAKMVKNTGRPSLTLPMISLITGHSVGRAVDTLFTEKQQIEDLWLNFFCVSANLTTGNMMVHQSGSLRKYVRASSSIPGILPPVVDGNSLLVDGATINNLPTDVMRELVQSGVVFASTVQSKRKNTKKKRRPREEYGKGLSGWRVLLRYLNPFTKPVNLPSIADIIMRSTVLSHRNMIEETEKLTDFKFELDVRPHSALDYDAYEKLAEIGYRTAQKEIIEWKKSAQWVEKGLICFSN